LQVNLSIDILHFNEKKKKLSLIKKPDGGGIHGVEVEREACYETLVQKASAILLANNPSLPIEDCLIVDAGHSSIKHKIPSPFTIQGYLKFLGKEKRPSKVSLYAVGREDYGKVLEQTRYTLYI
jgi:hypothetical protein